MGGNPGIDGNSQTIITANLYLAMFVLNYFTHFTTNHHLLDNWMNIFCFSITMISANIGMSSQTNAGIIPSYSQHIMNRLIFSIAAGSVIIFNNSKSVPSQFFIQETAEIPLSHRATLFYKLCETFIGHLYLFLVILLFRQLLQVSVRNNNLFEY